MRVVRIENHAEHGGTLNEHQLNRLVRMNIIFLQHNPDNFSSMLLSIVKSVTCNFLIDPFVSLCHAPHYIFVLSTTNDKEVLSPTITFLLLL